jgi:hypothetical protein
VRHRIGARSDAARGRPPLLFACAREQWEPAEISPASASVGPRLGHTLDAIGEKL